MRKKYPLSFLCQLPLATFEVALPTSATERRRADEERLPSRKGREVVKGTEGE